ncbi:class I SAM-dependent methyltransferase [Bermanella marisrubri]|uniref:Ribosomal RNA small subunit methyltransferase C n=1 Tax=Bermanella marisrubri TaxID=207949 RepID=Q1MZV1_9GAMM|nr:class I SAM-dependent methyltransferase [Bermanella marisrubri]EAT11456.1 ribosomal RNA small subunit methyltransferase C [Oceanobacter sp. RED65] [Bermanella marisrubri]QIZ85034.1 class I SAM-dependent methyltransferase [Bermanella marisrubri]
MPLAPPSQLLLQQDLPEHALLVNPPHDDLAQSIPSGWHAACFSHSTNTVFETQGFETVSVLAPKQHAYQSIIVYLPKSKNRLQYVIDYCCSSLADDGEIWFVGENKGGIKSLAKQTKKLFEQSDKFATGKHSAIVSASKPLTAKDFELQTYYQNQVNELDMHVQALPGVFSQEKLDKGTEVLLKNLPRKIKGRVLDFGCGAGVIGCYVQQHREVDEIDMLDDDLLAVKSAQRTIEKNSIPYAEAFASNGFDEVEDRYNWIISNPPFHQGVKTHYEVTEQFLAKAKDHLKLSGKLLIVANEFLSYEVILKYHFKMVKEVARENGFKVLQCEGIMRK